MRHHGKEGGNVVSDKLTLRPDATGECGCHFYGQTPDLNRDIGKGRVQFRHDPPDLHARLEAAERANERWRRVAEYAMGCTGCRKYAIETFAAADVGEDPVTA